MEGVEIVGDGSEKLLFCRFDRSQTPGPARLCDFGDDRGAGQLGSVRNG